MMMLNLESETHLGPCRKNLFAFIAMLILVLSTYSNTFHASWHFDDEPNILHSERLHLDELSWQKIKQTFFVLADGKVKIYRPAACLSFALNYYLGQEDVFGYHVVNLSIHFLSSLFLFLFVSQAFNLPRVGAPYKYSSYSVALLATVLWSINPVQTQAVTYIVQRMASMAAMFYIMSMYFYIKGRMSKKILLKIVHFFCCGLSAFLSFCSKENAVLLPMSLLLLDLFLIQGLERRNVKKNLAVFFAMVLIPLGVALILRDLSEFSLKNLIGSYGHRDFTFVERLLTQPRVLLLYLSLLFYPMPGRLSLAHDVSISHGFLEPPSTILAILFITFLLGITIIKSRKWPWPCYCVLFFFLNHSIESTIFPLELVFEHRNYLPSMLLFVPVAILMFKGIEALSYKKSMKTAFCTFIVLVLVGQGHSAFMRNFAWKTEESIWLSAIDHSPNLRRPYHNLGRYYGSLGEREKEIASYLHALELDKDSHGETRPITHFNLAVAYRARGEEDKAIEHLKTAIEINPRYSDAYNNLAAILIGKRRYDEAFDYLIKALTYDGEHTAAHNNLGVVALKKRLVDEAISEFRLALARDKESVVTLLCLGVAYKHKKDFLRARYFLRRALQKNTRNGIARLHLIETFYLMEDKKSLDALVEETLDVIPPEIMKGIVGDIAADNFPDQEVPDLKITLEVLGKAYLKRSQTLEDYGSWYLEKASSTSR
jgi:tetratricopeptide (TPR) repeat protein